MCQCPESLHPPNQIIARCRIILKVLALGMVLLIAASIVAQSYFSIIMFALLIFMLFLSWAQFNWCCVMIFFIYCFSQIMQSIILLVGLIQYHRIFQGQYIAYSVFIVMEVVYFPIAIVLSHYCYKYFKNLSIQNGGIFAGYQNMVEGQPVPPQIAQGQIPAQHQQLRPANQAAVDNPRVQPFQGQGVRIG